MPIFHITAPPIAPLVGGEQIILALEHLYDRIRGGAVTALLGEVGYGRVAVVYVDRVAIGLGLGPYGHQNPHKLGL